MKNAYEIRGDITAILINSPKYGRIEALISTSKLERVNELPNTWYVYFKKTANIFYVQGDSARINGKRKPVKLHRWITNDPKDMDVDHINHDGLINTDDNLRVCTHAENLQNRKGAQCDSKSGIRGVGWHKQREKWRAQVNLQGKQIYLGLFTDILEAEKAVIEARSKLMPYAS